MRVCAVHARIARLQAREPDDVSGTFTQPLWVKQCSRFLFWGAKLLLTLTFDLTPEEDTGCILKCGEMQGNANFTGLWMSLPSTGSNDVEGETFPNIHFTSHNETATISSRGESQHLRLNLKYGNSLC
jgi:hypothetical protein